MEFISKISKNYDKIGLKKIQEFYEILKRQIVSKDMQIKFEQGKNIALFVNTFLIDSDTICACLLLRLLRENLVDASNFNQFEDIVNLCSQVIKVESIRYQDKQVEFEDLRAMLVAIAKDIRVIIIKLCEVLYLAQNPNLISKEQLKQLHFEIKEVYSPLAGRLGLASIKSELNDLNLKYFFPKEYEVLENEVSKHALTREKSVNQVVEDLKKELKEQNISGTVYGRVKHISSIYYKLKDKNYTLSKIYDLSAVRVIVNTVSECYAVMGIVHSKYVPLDNRFKDYIARPKSNGYQSLHTTVIVNEEPLEIQIRTTQMHNHAEYGIAAHYLYKEHKTKKSSLDQRLIWIRKILENKENSSAREVLDQLKTDVYSGDIFVQTPLGKIIQLFENATPIDFAYTIHSEVGNKCVGAKVNGKMVPLNTSLKNGDIVEIITSQNSKGPSRDWLKIVKMQHSKNKINDFFKHGMKEENIKKGKLILEQASKFKGISLSFLNDEKQLKILLEKLAFNSLDEMYASIGYGSVSSTSILNKANNLFLEKENSIIDTPKVVNVSKKTGANIEGFETILTRIANCCKPIPGDEIIGYISRGHGLTIHRKDCSEVKYLEQDRLLNIKWANKVEDSSFSALIKVIVNNKTGVLSSITNKFTENKLNITFIKSENTKYGDSIINIGFLINNRQSLLDIINKVKSLPYVVDVIR